MGYPETKHGLLNALIKKPETPWASGMMMEFDCLIY
jgi:hypothetical protein